MKFDPSTAGGAAPTQPDTTNSDGKPRAPFDPSTAGADVPSNMGDYLPDPRDIGSGLVRGVTSMAYTPTELVSKIPGMGWAAPTAQQKEQALGPSKSWTESAARIVPQAIGAYATPELGLVEKMAPVLSMGPRLMNIAKGVFSGTGWGTAAPTESGSLKEHAKNALVSGVTGGTVSGVVGGSGAAQDVAKAGIRLPPGRMIPVVGPAWESLASHIPGLNRLVGNARELSLDDFQKALYQKALDGIGGKAPTEAGYAGLQQVRKQITDRLDNITQNATLPIQNVQALQNDVNSIIQRAPLTDTYVKVLQREVNDVLGNQMTYGASAAGQRLTGPNAIMNQLRTRIARFKDSEDGAMRDVGDQLQQVEQALMNRSVFNTPGGRADYDAASNAYAKYMTLERASKGKQGVFDPQSLLSELERGKLLGTDTAKLATSAKTAGVPRAGETDPHINPWLTAGTLGAGWAGEHFGGINPVFALPPALMYNPWSMTALMKLAQNAPQAGGFAGGQAAQNAPNPSNYAPSF